MSEKNQNIETTNVDILKTTKKNYKFVPEEKWMPEKQGKRPVPNFCCLWEFY